MSQRDCGANILLIPFHTKLTHSCGNKTHLITGVLETHAVIQPPTMNINMDYCADETVNLTHFGGKLFQSVNVP